MKRDLTSEGHEVADHIPLGVMIEVPAAAIALPGFIDIVDFLSIGTNDLVQYLLAADRNNEALGELYTPLHPALLRLLESVIRIARRRGKPVAVCGEMAGDAMFAPLLLALGLEEFSLHPGTLLELRRAIRTCDLGGCGTRTGPAARADRAGIEKWLKANTPSPSLRGAASAARRRCPCSAIVAGPALKRAPSAFHRWVGRCGGAGDNARMNA